MFGINDPGIWLAYLLALVCLFYSIWFGINDPGIWLAYLLALVCLFYSIWFGITHWNKDDEESTNPQQPEK